MRKPPAKGKYGEIDAVELVAFVSLVRALDWEDAQLAWEGVRERLRDRALSPDWKVILFDGRAKRSELLEHRADVGPAMTSGRPYVLIDVADAVHEARAAYARIRALEARASPAADAAESRVRQLVPEGGEVPGQ